MLAVYACKPQQSCGRLIKENNDPYRTCHQRDRDRILHSTAFRRLGYKTQVFVNYEGDHFRTRLTHSLEVGQIARALARTLRVNEDLAETVALAHDLGHTPFGHAGEEALHAVMQPYGGFDHNEQALRIITILENRYARFKGLNLTWETLEGIVKHNGPLAGEHATRSLPPYIDAYNRLYPLKLNTFASLEAQVAAMADDVTYSAHDIEDGLREEMIVLEDLYPLPIVGAIFRNTVKRYPQATASQWIHEGGRQVIRALVTDLIETTRRHIANIDPQNPDDIRNAGYAAVAFSAATAEAVQTLKAFLMKKVYRHYRVCRMTSKAQRIVTALFEYYRQNPECLPVEWQQGVVNAMEEKLAARQIADYIAGMTDRYAIKEHEKLFNFYKF